MVDAAPGRLRVLGSMATRGLVSRSAASWARGADAEAMGGVDAARRVREGAAVDVVVLADVAIRALAAEGAVAPRSLVPVAVSQVVAAVRSGEPPPGLGDGDAVRRAILAAPRIGYSTGPSGDHLLRLLDGWGVRSVLGARLVQAPPGIPVGRLLTEGVVDLAFQQRSEFMGLAGIAIAGPLPPDIRAMTVFTAGVARASTRPDVAGQFVAHLVASAAEAARHHGMEPA